MQAIQWAIDKEVDIINLSFGFDDSDQTVHSALKKAQSKRILIFAAMANGGVHEKAAWPAKSDLAIGIHSCVDLGARSSTFTPKPVTSPPNYNFMVIGERIPAFGLIAESRGDCYVEGTSFATPVAVAMAALILAFANQTRCRIPREECGRKLKKRGVHWRDLWLNEGMRRVLEAISVKSADGGYLSISHNLLWKEYRDERDTDEDSMGTNQAMRDHGWKVILDALWDMEPAGSGHVVITL
jgi:hypothetical protein